MHLVLLILGHMLMVLSVCSVLVYAPFAKTWLRALVIPFALTFIWSAVRVVTIAAFKEPSPPLIGFALTPFGYAFYAGLARGLKLLLFEIPLIAKCEERFSFRFRKNRKGKGGAH